MISFWLGLRGISEDIDRGAIGWHDGGNKRGEGIELGLFTWLRREFVGQDSFGNRYYREKRGNSSLERRWVVYKGLAEASKIPCDWHGWIHHTFSWPPCAQNTKRRPWEKKHLPNLTGTPYAYKPSQKRLKTSTTQGYKAWRPSKGTHENKSS